MLKIYTRQMDRESVLQAVTATKENRLPVLRNRIARAKAEKLAVIAKVAAARGDQTIAKEARAKLQALEVLKPGQKLDEIVTVKQSRRESRARDYVALAAQVDA